MHQDYKKIFSAVLYNNRVMNEQLITINEKQGKSIDSNLKIASFQKAIEDKINDDVALTVGEYMFLGVCVNTTLASLKGEIKRLERTLELYNQMIVPRLKAIQESRDLSAAEVFELPALQNEKSNS